MPGPEKPSGGPQPAGPPPGGVTCPSCGWPNKPGTVRCEFCSVVLDRAAVPRQAPVVECPHCGAVGPRTGPRCQACGRGYAEPPGVGRQASVLASDVVARLKSSWLLLFAAAIVVLYLLYAGVFLRGNAKATTADHIRQIKRGLQVYEGMTGGFPESLEIMEQRAGPLPSHLRKDAWDHPIRYQVSKPSGRSQETGEAVFLACEVRSAGPNGDFGDEDDIVWQGSPGAP